MRTVRCSGRRGVCIPACNGQGGVSQHALGRGLSAGGGVSAKHPILLWTEWLTDACENITVIMGLSDLLTLTTDLAEKLHNVPSLYMVRHSLPTTAIGLGGGANVH